MSTRTQASPPPDQGRALLETAGKTVLLVRLVALLLAAATTAGQAAPVVLAGVLVLVALNAVLLLRWSRLVAVVRRHPGLLALDVVVSLAALALPGSNAQLLYEAAGALLIGMVMPRAGAVLLTTLLASGQLLVGPGPAGGRAPAVTLVADAALLALLAGVGAVVRRGHDALLVSLAAVSRREAEVAHVSSASAERARLAREMHDGVAKSLFGMTLTATALARTAADPAARTLADDLAGCATACGVQVRELLGELRAVQGPGAAADLAAVVRAWSARTGTPVRADLLTPERSRSPGATGARAVAAAVLGEALDNVARHAGASAVDVRAADDGEQLTMTVHVRHDAPGGGLGGARRSDRRSPGHRCGALPGHRGRGRSALRRSRRQRWRGAGLVLRRSGGGGSGAARRPVGLRDPRRAHHDADVGDAGRQRRGHGADRGRGRGARPAAGTTTPRWPPCLMGSLTR